MPRSDHKKEVPDKKVLEEYYLLELLSISELARKFNTSNPTIRKWLKGYQIPLRTHKETTKIFNSRNQTGNNRIQKESLEKLKDKNWLYNQHVIHKKSVPEIADFLQISTTPVIKWLKKHNIEKIDGRRKYTQSLDSQKIIQEYQEGKDLREIAKNYNTSASSIQLLLLKGGISRRNSNEYKRKFHKNSKAEKEILNRIREYYDGDIFTGNRKLLNGLEVDILIPEKKFAIEYNGIYYHSSIFKDKNYHLNKTEKAKEKGYTLLHIFEDDYERNPELIHSMIRYRLGFIDNRIAARKCYIREISSYEYKRFLEENHIQGSTNSRIKLGLFDKEVLVSCIGFSKSRYNKDCDYELVRFCVLKNTSVSGGFSKLLKYFVRNYCDDNTKIITYALRSYSEGNLYRNNGFDLIRTNKPEYYYLKDGKKQNRIMFQKKNLLKQEIRNGTEEEMAYELGYVKIWGCGTETYVYDCNKKGGI